MESDISLQGGLDDPNQFETIWKIAIYAQRLLEAFEPNYALGVASLTQVMNGSRIGHSDERFGVAVALASTRLISLQPMALLGERVSASSKLRLEASVRITYVRVFVIDLAAAKKFYAQILGLEILWEYENKAIGFDVGPVLIVEDVSSEEDREERGLAGRFVGCSIEVEDIQATYSQLVAKGVHFTTPPEKQEWGGTLAHFEDPAGNVWTLVG